MKLLNVTNKCRNQDTLSGKSQAQKFDACPPWRDAFEYYELQLPGLGRKFFNEVLETLELISRFPKLWSQNSEHTRKAVLRKFPYNLIYSIYQNKINIIAVAHQNRTPEYWIDRLQEYDMVVGKWLTDYVGRNDGILE